MLPAAAAAAGSASAALAAAETRVVGADEKITAATIGCGIRGKAHARELSKLPQCEVTWLCDPDPTRADEVAKLLVENKRARRKRCKTCGETLSYPLKK